MTVGGVTANFTGTVTQPLVNSHQVIFYFNNNTSDNVSEQVGEGMYIQEPNKPNYEGHNFLNWNTNQDGNGIIWDFATMAMPSENLTLYAQWEPASYTLSFNLNGGNEDVLLIPQILEFNSLATAI